MLYRVLASLTIIGVLGIVSIVLIGSSGFDYSTGGIIATASGVAIAVGLMTMIGHLNLSGVPSETEKTEWRRYLTFGGPIAAAAYLWTVAGRPASAETQLNVLEKQRPQRVHPFMFLALAVGLAGTTLAVGRNLPDDSSLLTYYDLMLLRTLQIGTPLMGSMVLGFLRMRFWPHPLLILAPSLSVLYLQNANDPILAVGLVSGAGLLSWAIVTMMKRSLPEG